jgi:hypothetical protein
MFQKSFLVSKLYISLSPFLLCVQWGIENHLLVSFINKGTGFSKASSITRKLLGSFHFLCTFRICGIKEIPREIKASKTPSTLNKVCVGMGLTLTFVLHFWALP